VGAGAGTGVGTGKSNCGVAGAGTGATGAGATGAGVGFDGDHTGIVPGEGRPTFTDGDAEALPGLSHFLSRSDTLPLFTPGAALGLGAFVGDLLAFNAAILSLTLLILLHWNTVFYRNNNDFNLKYMKNKYLFIRSNSGNVYILIVYLLN